MKILITYPPLKTEKGIAMVTQNRQFQWYKIPSCLFPLVPASAATLLQKEGFDVHWKDAIIEGLSLADYFAYVRTVQPDLIVLEGKTPVIRKIWTLIAELKQQAPNAKVVLMGDHVTAFPRESLENSDVDFILTGGDFDFMLLNLCRHLATGVSLEPGFFFKKDGQIQTTGPFELNHDLDSLPLIDRELTRSLLYNQERNMKYQPHAYTMAGRDCPYGKCKFCSWTTLYPKFRVRSVQNYLDEVGLLIERYQIKEIFDDTGTFPTGAWLKEFCAGMIDRGYNKQVVISCNMRAASVTEESAILMKKAGFRLLKMGLESANQETLDRIDKNTRVEQIYNACRILKGAGLEVHLTTMVGYPWETRADAMRTYNMLKELMEKGYADVFQSTIVVPYPGTPLFREALENNWFLIDPKDYEQFDMKQPVLKTGDMTRSEVTEFCNRMFRIYFSPRHILRKIIGIKPSEIPFLVRGACAAVGHLFDFRNP
jgi:anaerobic magnesium-protoporphyrin IX monomethyl ester cyclase